MTAENGDLGDRVGLPGLGFNEAAADDRGKQTSFGPGPPQTASLQ